MTSFSAKRPSKSKELLEKILLNETESDNKKMLSILLTQQEHSKLKKAAVDQNVSMKQLILLAVELYLKDK
jgi:hypothetical protein